MMQNGDAQANNKKKKTETLNEEHEYENDEGYQKNIYMDELISTY